MQEVILQGISNKKPIRLTCSFSFFLYEYTRHNHCGYVCFFILKEEKNNLPVRTAGELYKIWIDYLSPVP
jgi:hypothetical protein